MPDSRWHNRTFKVIPAEGFQDAWMITTDDGMLCRGAGSFPTAEAAQAEASRLTAFYSSR